MEKLDLHGKTGFIIGGTRGIDTYEYHNTCAEAMLPLDGDAYIHVAPAGPADHVPYDEVEVFRVPKGRAFLHMSQTVRCLRHTPNLRRRC